MVFQCQNNSFTLFGLFDFLTNISELNRITTDTFSNYSSSFANEMTPTGPSNAIRLENKDEGIVIMIRSNSVVITKSFVPSALMFKVELVKDFCLIVEKLLSKLFNGDYVGNRIAIRTQCFILDPKYEYTRRIVSRFCGEIPLDLHINMNNPVSINDSSFQETLNVIRNIDSAKATAPLGNGKTIVSNALSIRTDINTTVEKNELRFGKSNLGFAFNHLVEQDEKIFNELNGLLNETKE